MNLGLNSHCCDTLTEVVGEIKVSRCLTPQREFCIFAYATFFRNTHCPSYLPSPPPNSFGSLVVGSKITSFYSRTCWSEQGFIFCIQGENDAQG